MGSSTPALCRNQWYKISVRRAVVDFTDHGFHALAAREIGFKRSCPQIDCRHFGAQQECHSGRHIELTQRRTKL